MGNSKTKNIQIPSSISDNHVAQRNIEDPNRSVLSSFIGSLSNRSFASYNSTFSVYSASRPWSRVSRRRWNDSTLSDPLLASKTAWPVANIESYFLPEFKIDCNNYSKQFDYISTISKGAFGKVYKVLHTETKKTYAFKILSKSQIISENSVKQVKDEVHIQEVCGHNPFIVGCHLKWQSRKRLYIVTEFVPGGELLQLIESYCKLPQDLVQIYVAQIGIVIDFLHNAGIVYRDLKPENLLLDEFGNLQLIDFGLSKWLKFGCKTSTLCGTLNYMAPEVMSREPYGHAVDWWSLGIVMWRMLTNEFPNKNCPLSEELGNLDESEATKKLIIRLLENNPIHRLRSLKSLQETAFFKGFDFNIVKHKNIHPSDILKRYFPQGPPIKCTEPDNEMKQDEFYSFDHLNLS